MILSLLSQGSTSPADSSPSHDDLSFQDISFLTFEAVLEVVIICFAGFIAAKTGLLNSKGQKVISQLNVDLFTPCLVFTKLAPSLSFEKMADIVIIPIFYAISTGISFLCSKLVSYYFGLNNPESDYVTAMAVFGNSNSLPVSLTLSLAYTLPDLLWDDLQDDTNDKVASRGILYLLIFQQLGQILRWSWGYNKLLKKRSKKELNNYALDDQFDEEEQTLQDDDEQVDEEQVVEDEHINESSGLLVNTPPSSSYTSRPSSVSSNSSNSSQFNKSSFPSFNLHAIKRGWKMIINLPILKNILSFMNPPLYSMLISVIIASVPYLQNLFFNDEKSFVRNTLTNSINQLGQVSIPLILIVLGSNLYPSKDIPPPSKHYTKIVIGSLLSRMILPPILLLPIIAMCVKFINISILDDPIFLIVSFILTISPPAIQLSQITQINNIYQKEMSGVLFWGYVILTLPTTIFIVVTSLEVLKWAL